MREADRNSKPLDRTRDEEEVVGMVNAMWREARAACEERHREIRKSRHFYFGKQWLTEEDEPAEAGTDYPHFRQIARMQRDVCFETVESLRPLVIQGYPKVFVTADFPEGMATQAGLTDADLADRMTAILEAEHTSRSEGIQYAKLMWDVLVGGIGTRKLVPDVARNRINAVICDPLDVLGDPYGELTPGYESCKYVIHEVEMDMSDIERRYGLKAEDYAGSEDDDTDIEGEGLIRKVKQWIRGKEDANPQVSETYQRRRFPVVECWYNEGTPIETLSDKPPKSLKYPHGRHIVVVNHKKLAVDQPNPFWHGEYPFVAYMGYPIPRSMFAWSDMDQLRSVQVAINVLYSQVIMNAVLTSNTQWIFEEGVVPKGWLTNEPGLNIEVPPGMMDRIQRLDPARVPADVMGLVHDLVAHAQGQTASEDVLRGREPSAGSPGIAIAQLQNAAMNRHSFRMQVLDDSLKHQARLEVALLQQFADFMDVKYQRQRGNDFGEAYLWDEAMRQLLYDVNVESKADLPHNLMGRINFAFEMMRMGVFDLEEFLRFTGVKVREDLRAKIRAASEGFIPGEQQGSEGAPGQAALSGVPGLGSGVPGGLENLTGGAA